MKHLLIILLCVFVLNKSSGADFFQAYNVTLQHEGGAVFTSFHYDNDGGGTKYGITLKTLKAISKSEKGIYDNDNDGKITKNDLRLMSFGQGKAIYKKYYWDKLSLDSVRSQLLAGNIYDFHVNGGINAKSIQKIVGVRQDGIIGQLTLNRINSLNECTLTRMVIRTRGNWLFVMMKKYRPQTYANCRRGWANRVNTFIKQFNKNCNEKFPFYRT